MLGGHQEKMIGWTFALGGLLAFAALTIIWTNLERKRQRGLGERRSPLTKNDFISAMMKQGIRSSTAEFVWDQASSYYFAPLAPDPSDRWEGTMKIDPGDLEDLAANFWSLMKHPMPKNDDPVILPKDPSLLELASWLDSQGRDVR